MVSANETLILASASPVRARLLADAGVDFSVEPAEIDEAALKSAFRTQRQKAAECALALAEAKAQSVSRRHQQALVIGADQILVCDGAWFDKPVDLAAARAQLQALRGHTHLLTTAACVLRDAKRVWHHVSSPKLTMRRFGDGFLDAYLAAEGGAILGSVGAYRLEARGVQLFDRIEGDYFSILGLPLIELVGFLREYEAIPS
jgi:septum formation protein